MRSWLNAATAVVVPSEHEGFGLAAVFAATGESHAAVFAAGLVFSLAAFGTAVRLARPAKP